MDGCLHQHWTRPSESPVPSDPCLLVCACRSAFFVFCSEYRPSVKQQYPGLSIGDCAKKLGEMWSKLSQSEKQPYEEKAQKLREKYDRVSVPPLRPHPHLHDVVEMPLLLFPTTSSVPVTPPTLFLHD